MVTIWNFCMCCGKESPKKEISEEEAKFFRKMAPRKEISPGMGICPECQEDIAAEEEGAFGY